MSKEKMITEIAEHIKGHTRLFTPGNNYVLNTNNRTAEMIASWVVKLLEEKNIKF